MALVSLEEAQAYVLERVDILPVVDVALDDALGTVVATDVVATEAVPSCENSAMDGYAVRAVDTSRAPVELKVIGTLAAGHSTDVTVGEGEAMRIMTGAPLPAGADAVVLVERTSTAADTVTIDITVNTGTSVRRVGEDVHDGDVAAATGTLLTPARLGVLASIGAERVSVYRTPRVGVLSTGDELVTRGPIRRGQIRNSNRPILLALVRAAGLEAVDLGTVSDDEASITKKIARATAACDAVLSTGGVSVGDFDYLKVVLDRIGDTRWMQVAVKPAKPFVFAMVGRVPVFGLPGNPVSAIVSFELLVRPALLRMAGQTDIHRLVVPATARDGFLRKPDGKTHFVKVVATQDLEGLWFVQSAGDQGPGQLAAMAAANGLAILPDGGGVGPGDKVRTMLLARG